MYDIFTDSSTHLGQLFVAVGNTELSNNMASYDGSESVSCQNLLLFC
jgi:hypothetical protein